MGKVACGVCKKFLSPIGAATCTVCAGTYHRGCLSIPESGTVCKDWVCPVCKKKTKKGGNTPVGGEATVTLASTSIAASGTSPSISSLLPVPLENPLLTPPMDTSIMEMRRELAEYMVELRLYRGEMVEFRATMAAMNERVEGIERRLDVIEAKEEASGAVEVADLERTVTQLKSELNDRDQEALLADLDIGQFPEVKGESAIHSVTILAAKLGLSLESRDIVFAERVGPPARSGSSDTEGRPRRLVVRLARRHLRDELLSAARVRRTLISTDLGLPAPPQRIFLNERLTGANRQLFHRVREECKKNNWRYSWTKKGRPYARESEGKPAYPFRTEADVIRIFKIKCAA